MWELRDAYEDLAPLYARAWRYESRDGHLASNLERYHLAAQQAIECADAFYRRDAAVRDRPSALPPLEQRPLALSAALILFVFAVFAVLMYRRWMPALDRRAGAWRS